MNQKEIRGYTPTGFGQYAEGLGTLRASGGDYGGGTEVLIVSYQEITGCLSQGAHPGSYNGQDAYNDMLVINESSKHGQWATAQHGDGRTSESSGLYARCPSNPNREREREREREYGR